MQTADWPHLLSGPTQENGHTLDLVLSYGLPIFNLEVCATLFSDHMPVLVDVSLPCHIDEQRAPARQCCMLKPSTANRFSSAFTRAPVPPSNSASPGCVDTDEVISRFVSTRLRVLETVAPLRTRRKPITQPWLDDRTRGARGGQSVSGKRTSARCPLTF